MGAMHGDKVSDDPCRNFGPNEKRAVVWFFAVLIIGIFASFKLAGIDRWMYDNNGELFDVQKFRENRMAGTSIATESLDHRLAGDYQSVTEQLRK